MSKNQKRQTFKSYMEILALLLTIAFGLSLLAPYHWFCDLFVNFTIQYAIGGLVLAAVFLCYKDRRWLVLPMLAIGMSGVYFVRTSYSDPWQMPPPHAERPNLTLVQYNKLFGNPHWDQIDEWVRDHHQDIDIMFVQESGVTTLYKLQELKKYFPYQFPSDPKERFNDISIMSRYPFEAEEIPSLNINAHMPGVKVTLQTPTMPAPVHLYSIHTQVPLGEANYKERSEDIFIMQEAIKQDPYPYKTFSGDFNLTPYSPVFKNLIKETGLQYNDYKWFPNTTWNSVFYFPFLRIPIDHTLYTPQMKLISREVGPSLGSDHHLVMAKFYIAPLEASKTSP
ncbi:MAG: endonuclease/exonuclease/phosphatase family protein [Rhodospirillales bacterium]|nr:endonuclease/exonuclease/phosphatase family protein [Rhodospirillales bacterium]